MIATVSRRRWIWIAGWLLLFAFVVVAFRNVDWREAAALAQGASWRWLIVAVLANASILLLVAWQWVILLPGAGRVGFPSMLWITAVTSTVSNGGPFLAGHAAGVHLLATRGGVGYATAVSVKALDQLTEGIAKLLLFAAAVRHVPSIQ